VFAQEFYSDCVRWWYESYQPYDDNGKSRRDHGGGGGGGTFLVVIPI